MKAERGGGGEGRGKEIDWVDEETKAESDR